MAGRIIFAEVSKVRHYHSTVMNGFVKAWYHVGADRRWGRPIVYAHPSFVDALNADVRERIDIIPIAVIDPDKRQILRKSLHEALTTLRLIRKADRDDTLIITTIFPSAMPIVELFAKLLRRKNVIILQHSEVEEGCTNVDPKPGSYGHANLIWHRMRPAGSWIRIAVLGSWIADAMRQRFPRSFARQDILAIPMPVEPYAHPRRIAQGHVFRCGFIGFNTPAKGYEIFESLSHRVADIDFFQIGAGKSLDIRTGAFDQLRSAEDFMDALSACDVAVMPNTSGYDFTLSAAATDAISAGAHLLTSNRGCYRALRDEFGPECVTICDNEQQMQDFLTDTDWRARILANRGARLARIEQAEFSLSNVGKSLEDLMISPSHLPPSEAPERQAARVQ